VDHGCGAHSQAFVLSSTPQASLLAGGFDGADLAVAPLGHEAGSVSDDAEVAEPLGHS
jgi:hypothetical protein